jgi:hypothetical protein
MSELELRVKGLERRLQWIVTGGVLGALSLTALLVVPKASSASTPDKLTTRMLAIVDQKGVERFRLAAPLPDPTEGGSVSRRRSPANGIQINDANGNERGGLMMLDDGTLTICFDSKTSEAACMYVMPSGERGFAVTDDHSKDRAKMILLPGKNPELTLVDGSGKVFWTAR